MESLKELFTEEFMPHGHCFFWKPGILWTSVLSDTLIALAYFSIPIALIYFIRRRKDLPFNWIFILFSLFILLCGLSHIMSVLTMWQPIYAIEVIIKALTALAS
ncbi:MAG: hybrid sensor histidine kinase/response regulator, partial [Deltaproteobacteria bacterium]|nr:hybrid sensor histidine kinase/response regulator [Deltaproteobacteria bacterium]